MLDGIRKGQCPLSLFLSNVNECVSNRVSKEYVKRLVVRTYGQEVEFKRYLHGPGLVMPELDSFKFRSGTHGLNEELGRHRGRNGMTECIICDDE